MPHDQLVRVVIVLDVHKNVIPVAVWAQRRTQTLIDELYEHGVHAALVLLDIE
jgi:hypothetical protein